MSDHEEYCLRPLWGGAAHAEMPTSFVDVSDLRQVPDHQECWMDGGGGILGSNPEATPPSSERLLVFEILELRESVKDSDAARFYFRDLAEANGDLSSSTFDDVSQASLMSRVVVPGGTPGSYLSVGSGTQRVRMGRDHDFRGQPTVGQEVRRVRVEIAVLRLPLQQTDVLITLSTPIGTIDHGDVEPPTAWSEPFQRAVCAFEILDWSLFGSATHE